MLGDFPIEVVNIIMEKVDPIERLKIRKVSRKLRILIDQISDPVETIRIDIENILTTIYLNNRKVFYKDNGIVEFDGKRKVIEGEHHTEMALNDLKIILQNTKLNLQDFTIMLYVTGDNSKIRETYLKIIQKFWNNLICIKSQRSLIGGFTFRELVYILPKFKAQKLEDLRLDMCQKVNEKRSINELVQLEQWKRAKSVEFTRNYLVEIPIRNLIFSLVANLR